MKLNTPRALRIRRRGKEEAKTDRERGKEALKKFLGFEFFG